MADNLHEVVENKRGKSNVWKFFGLRKRKSDGKIEDNVAVCKRCHTVVRNAGGTTNLTTHMRRHHALDLGASSLKSADNSTACSTDTTMKKANANDSTLKPQIVKGKLQPTLSHVFSLDTSNSYAKTSHRAQHLNDKVARFIIKGLRPVSVVDSSEFRDLVDSLDTRYNMPSRTTFAERIIPQMYRDVRKRVQGELSTTEQVAFTTDGWTSCATDSYITVTSCYININWEIVNFVLQTRLLNESHTAENIADVIKEAVEDWKILTVHGFPPVATDNAANVTKAVQLCESVLHIPCLAHTINLLVQKSLKVKRVSHVLAKVRRIVGFFHRSPISTSLLKQKSLLLDLPSHDLIIDVVTRWNSAYEMLSRFLKMHPAVVTVLMSKEMPKAKGDLPSMSDEDIQLIDEIIQLLKPMKDITKMLSSEECPTVSVILPLKHHLMTDVLSPNQDDSPTISEMKRIMHADLKQRYDAQTDTLKVASALDPRFKHQHFMSDEEKYDVYGNLTSRVAKLYSNFRGQVVVKTEPETDKPELPQLPCLQDLDPDEITTEEKAANNISLSVEPDREKEQIKSKSKSLLEGLLGDVFVVKEEPAKTSFELAKLEVDQYCIEAGTSLSENCLVWWRKSAEKYPSLAMMAKMILCIPPTSVPSERVFSTAGDIVSHQRASMRAENVDMLLFLKKNLK